MGNSRHDERFYYGWVVVGLAFCSLGFWFGIRTSFSVFYVVLGSEFLWAPAALAGAQSASLSAAMISAPVIGALLDRLGPRKVILSGILITSAGLALSSIISSLFEFYIYYGVIAGSAAMSFSVLSYSAVLRHWFQTKRGVASGIAVSGMGVGMLFFVPMVQYGISNWGWRYSFLFLSAFGVLCLFPATLFFLRDKPTNNHDKAISSNPDGMLPPPARKRHGAEKGFQNATIIDIVRQAVFWNFILFAFFASVGVYIILVHSVKFLVDKGTDAMLAAVVLAFVGLISSVFRIFWGWLSDRSGRALTYTMGSLCACLGIGCLMLRGVSEWSFLTYLFALFFGIGWGATAPLVMASSADIFDGSRYGFIFGLVQGIINLAGAVGAWLGGFFFGRYHSYEAAFSLALVSFLLSCVFMWKASPGKKTFT